MNLEKILSDIEVLILYPITQKSVAALLELNRLNKLVYGDTVYAGCSNCHIKAFKLLKSLTLDDLKIMTQSKFKIKKDHLIEWPFRGGTFYHANAPMSNEVAAEYLGKHPDNVNQFEVYPGSELDIPIYTPLVVEPASREDLAKMTKKELQVEYLRVFGEKPKTKDTAEDLLKVLLAVPEEEDEEDEKSEEEEDEKSEEEEDEKSEEEEDDLN